MNESINDTEDVEGEGFERPMSSYGKKGKSYTQVQLQLAYEACQNGMSQNRACKMYGVPRSTLGNRLQHKIDYLVVRSGPKSLLSMSEELPMVEALHGLADAGFKLSRRLVLSFAADYVKANQTQIASKNPFSSKLPTSSWLACFLRRHPKLAERTGENWAYNGKDKSSSEPVPNWFQCATKYLEKKDSMEALQKRQQVFNVDDVPLVMKVGKKLVTFSCLFGADAYGNLLPPLVLYPKGIKLPSAKDQSNLNYPVACQDTEETAGNALYHWFSKVFQPWSIEKNVPRPAILFIDGRRLTMNYRSSEFCKQNQILPVSLLPRSMHTQLLEYKLFPLLRELSTEEKKKAATDKSVDQLLNSVLSQLEDTENIIREGFYQSNIYPWNHKNLSGEPIPTGKIPKKLKVTKPKPTAARKPVDPMLTLFRRMLESRLSNRQLVEFQAQRHSESWTGPVEETCLFQVWRDLQYEIDTYQDLTDGEDGAQQDEGWNVDVVIKEEDPGELSMDLVKEEPNVDDEEL